jgi:hypothetical protein
VGKDANVLTMEEVKNTVLDTSSLGSQFADPITQIVNVRPPQFMAKLLKESNSRNAVPIGLPVTLL